jgi:hypothetical protein
MSAFGGMDLFDFVSGKEARCNSIFLEKLQIFILAESFGWWNPG